MASSSRPASEKAPPADTSTVTPQGGTPSRRLPAPAWVILLLICLVVFSLASLAGGVATGTTWLIIARAVQGIGAAILSPATLTIITTTFTDAETRAKALGAWSAVAAAGGVVGNILGGVLTGLLNWRWVLFINIPIGAVLIVVAVVALTGGRDRAAHGLDVLGAITTTVGLAALIYGIVQS